MQLPRAIEIRDSRVLTTKQIAECYETSARVIANNFNRNRSRYISEKHFICLEGQKLKNFKTNHQFDYSLKVNKLYLWTEKGALLHAKSLNTDKAWEVYDYLVDFYFRAKETETMIKLPSKKHEDLKISSDDIKRIYTNRGIIKGIYRAETGRIENDIIKMYTRLSDFGKAIVISMILGEVDDAE